MSELWSVKFGTNPTVTGGKEYFAYIESRGEPIDTFYDSDAHALFEQVAELMESHVTGIGFGRVHEPPSTAKETRP